MRYRPSLMSAHNSTVSLTGGSTGSNYAVNYNSTNNCCSGVNCSGCNCDCKCNDCKGGGGGGDGAAVLLVIVAVIVIIFALIGFIYGLILLNLAITKIVQKHYAVAQRRVMTRNYIVRDLDGIHLPPPDVQAESLPCAPPINEVELQSFGLI